MELGTYLTETLEDLVEREFKQFKWHLQNGVRADIEAISRGKLEKADRQDTVDLMVQYYDQSAGNITVQVLRTMKQNNLAKELEKKLQNIQQPEPEEEASAEESEDLAPIDSDWGRPPRVISSKADFKKKVLKEQRSDIYIPSSTSHRKGLALLITNIIFSDPDNNREGAEKDEASMDWLLSALGFTVIKRRNLTGEEIRTEVQRFSRRLEHEQANGAFVIIMSHGDRIENKDAILGVNFHKRRNPTDVYFIEEVFSSLNSINCPRLIDKPKVILIQACRGGLSGGVKLKDSVCPEESGGAYDQDFFIKSDPWVHREKDFACFMSALPHISAFRSPVNGSFFISYILDVFCKSAHHYHIMELFRKVAARMAKDPRFGKEEKLLPCIERTSLVKKYFLFPGL
ncbi:hypothetical protein DNTS_031457 [Danionella cerebrum]|uniref:Caspase family p20 domain-containing protein n=1 Tax=Danionella cerebrum TaxID=2873325 RepID=A0A553QQ97_9TELE|nr:hypothetical protein DNTS_031457 [Danionella translucida]